MGEDRGQSPVEWTSGSNQSMISCYRVVHLPPSSFFGRFKGSSAVWSPTQVLGDSWLQQMGLLSPGMPQEAVIIPERVHGRSQPEVFRRESPSQDDYARLSSLWSHDDVD